MDITLIGRGVGITDRFRAYALEKTGRVEHLAEKALALEIRLCRHHDTDGTDDRVELTLIGPGPVARAESGGVDKYAAFDAALGKLMERIRRAKDRRKPHHGHGGRMQGVRDVVFDTAVAPITGSVPVQSEPADEAPASPVVLRHKRFEAEPISVDDALYRMELVGHDFYLFLDAATGLPSVVYKRIGWNYGVIALGGEGAVPREPARERVPATV